ncbi:gamma-glutamylcyclotransferase (GGCT)/AIG2-like uncharacterized protein YtfP [Melghirimyces profundicolus]|uniref:Gamma-glutamylcyclotransferase (GGCT)/AIG2-like uncharacterized protein YtfP n=1 Tax=Melghirimyces profundicolus TaxID=1242148 RepID=A0A2T6BW79_9BACL|nr:gamma-glutamylcyclotransferase family protein [Melghirimyces profundicolus]PTX60276.1 gamma-glutamylcyclotransferase (GGCT)/AIG2-like uncharacterized protein YtfP [Melghirimyces profundicolus]
MTGKKQRVFVYGSLRRGEKYHSLMARVRPEAMQAWTEGELFDTGRGYPGLAKGRRRVYGEVYRVNSRALARIDRLEGHREEASDIPGEFRRIRRRVLTDRGPVEAYVYLFNGPRKGHMENVPYGDWKARHLDRRTEWLYFAYGSCMDDERIRSQGVGEEFLDVVGRGVLRGHAMRYTLPYSDGGRADVVEHPGSTVEGKVYRIGRKGLNYLFWREGVDSGVYRPAWVPVVIRGITVENVLTFIVIEKGKETPPPEHYAREILRGSEGTVSEVYHRRLRRYLKEKFKMTVSY